MYHNGMNSIWKNKATLFPQISMIDDDAITNRSNQSVEGCVPQEQGQYLTPNIVAGNDVVQDRIVYHRINHISQNVTIPNLPQRTYPIPATTTTNFVLDKENMHHIKMNSVLQNEATLFPQISMIDDVIVTN